MACPASRQWQHASVPDKAGSAGASGHRNARPLWPPDWRTAAVPGAAGVASQRWRRWRTGRRRRLHPKANTQMTLRWKGAHLVMMSSTPLADHFASYRRSDTLAACVPLFGDSFTFGDGVAMKRPRRADREAERAPRHARISRVRQPHQFRRD
jgi:hypothetical protein